MSDDLALLVPIHIDALLVNALVANGGVIFERLTNSWEQLNSFKNPIPPPWGSASPIAQGVHLHWQLPAALTQGEASSGSSNAVFPHTPNRWIVVRLTAAAQGSTAQAMTVWVVESDYLNANDGSTPYVDPSSTPGDLKPTLLGRAVPVAQWTGELQANGQLFLTATGIAQATFLAYQPGLLNVYSFYDDTTELAENTRVTYLVAGWYSNSAFDPLILDPAFDAEKSLFTDLNWLVLGLGSQPQPTRSVFHGLVNDLIWQTSSIPERIDESAKDMQVALGYTAVDALAAILGQSNDPGGPSPEQIEMMLAAFQYDALHLLDEPDATAQLELRIRKAWFGSTPGGTLWEIVPVAQGQTTADPLSRIAQPAPVPLNQAQQQWLAEFNTAQRQLDVAQRELRTMQWELFALWWKKQYITANLLPDGLHNWGTNATALNDLLAAQIDPTQSKSFFSNVSAKRDLLAQMQSALPIPSSPESVATFSRDIPGNGGGLLMLKADALPPFFHPGDPVLLVAGITPPVAAPDKSVALPCRVVSAATTGVNVEVGGHATPVTASTGKLGGIVQQPGDAAAGGGKTLSSLLDPLVAAALAALSTEAFFADPNNATSTAANGLSNTDPVVIAALQAAMTAGTAQISTIPNPLQATFAFSLWQQAWTPLFLEWNLQFYPTVQTNFTGQPLPPQSLSSGAAPVRDNLPMDLPHWTFNGGNDVFARGSEFYSWAGGDIWTPNSWLVPQQFQGRTSLTPNAETLFLARLDEYIAKQPVASATAVITNGVVTAVNLGNGGAGFSQPPAITFSGGGGTGAGATAVLKDGVITAIDVTSGGSGYTSTPVIAIGPSDWASLQALIDEIGETRFLSQTLGGFNINFLMQTGMHVLSPDEKTAAILDGEDRAVPNPGLGNVPIRFGQGQPFFFPVRGGYFCLNQLQIVDGFGQILDLLQANGNSSGGSASFQPILGAGLLPEASIVSSNYQIKQAPRVVQPSRLNLRWLDAMNDQEEVFLSAGANPVCGWLIPNHLDHSIAVYDPAGGPLGELLVLMQTTGEKDVKWLPAPGSPTSAPAPSDIPNPHLRDAISAFTESGGGIPPADRVAAFQAWFNSIDETLWTVDPPGGQTDSELAVLIGRPLAVVRLQLSFELYGRPSYNQSWRDTFDLASPPDQSSIEVGQQEAGFTALPFPIQMGSTELLADGFIGYFSDDSTAFNAVHAASSPASPYIQPIGGSNTIGLPFNYPNYTLRNITAVIDPLGTIHATTGTLPVAEISLPAEFYAAALSTMAVSFRIGPVLTDPSTIRIPLPTEQYGDWSWVWQPAPGSYQTDGVVVADAKARLSGAPPHMMEGWLVLTPSKPVKS